MTVAVAGRKDVRTATPHYVDGETVDRGGGEKLKSGTLQ